MHPKPDKILMLCSWYPNRVQPANGNFVEKHIRLLSSTLDIQVLQVEYDPNMPAGQTEWSATAINGYQLLTIYFGSKAKRFRRLIQKIQLFNKAFDNFRLDGQAFKFVHVHVAMPGVLLARYWYARYGLDFVLSCHSSGFLAINPKAYPWWQRHILVACANAAHMVCPVSQALTDAWRKNGLKTTVRVIPNVVNTTLFYPATVSPTGPPLQLLHVSNFDPSAKNVEGLLRVAQKLTQDSFPFQLTIAGDGDLGRIKTYVKQLQLTTDQVILKGRLAEAEVGELMRQHHVFVLFSNYETQGVTLLEAQCCGLPVIATCVGGIPEIVDEHWKGVLVEAGDEDGLVQVIKTFSFETLAYSNQLRISKEAGERFSEEGVRNAILALYPL